MSKKRVKAEVKPGDYSNRFLLLYLDAKRANIVEAAGYLMEELRRELQQPRLRESFDPVAYGILINLLKVLERQPVLARRALLIGQGRPAREAQVEKHFHVALAIKLEHRRLRRFKDSRQGEGAFSVVAGKLGAHWGSKIKNVWERNRADAEFSWANIVENAAMGRVLQVAEDDLDDFPDQVSRVPFAEISSEVEELVLIEIRKSFPRYPG